MNLTRPLKRDPWAWCIGLWTLLLVAVIVTLVVVQPCWLIGQEESGAVAIRNLVLAMAALVALPTALWRTLVAQKQAETAQRQSLTAQAGVRTTRYYNGASMLGNKELTVRLGGIYALRQLAEEDPEEY